MSERESAGSGGDKCVGVCRRNLLYPARYKCYDNRLHPGRYNGCHLPHCIQLDVTCFLTFVYHVQLGTILSH